MRIRKDFGRKKTGYRWKNNSQTYLCLQRWSTRSLSNSGLLIFHGKKAKFRGIFGGKFAEKSADFAGKKSKFAEKSADFAGFSQEKSQNSQKNWPISRDFSGKNSKFVEKSADFARFSRESQITKDFPGQILRKIGRFHGKFRGKLRQETISKKQPISLDFLGANLAKIDQFCVDMTSVF